MAASGGSPIQHQGQSWLSWSDKFGLKSDEESDISEDDQTSKFESDAMKLRKEDMTLFGFCPARDDFFLVVCEMCGIVVKPQALRHHIDVRHGGVRNDVKTVINKTTKSPERSKRHDVPNGGKERSKKNHVTRESSPIVRMERIPPKSVQSPNSKHSPASILPSPQQPPPPPDPGKTKQAHESGRIKSSSPDSGKSKNSVNSVAGSVKAKSGSTSVSEKIRNSSPDPSKLKSTASEFVKNKTLSSDPVKVKSQTTDSSNTKTYPPDLGKSKSLTTTIASSETSSVSKKSSSNDQSVNSSGSKRSSKSRNKTERKLLLCKDREYDPNKHCGVLHAETGKSCTRSLTCKTHSLSARRAVPGRKKNFDELLSDHRAAKEALLKAAQSGQPTASCPSPPKLSQGLTSKAVRPTSLSSSINSIPKSLSPGPPPLMKQCKSTSSHSSTLSSPNKMISMPNLLSPKDAASTVSPVSGSMKDFASPEPISPSKSFLQSSSIIESPESIYKPKHPRPAAMCTFGARKVGQGLFVFNRRQDVFRAVCKSLVSEQSSQPPTKKLCLDSRLPPVPDHSDDPSDPYSFTCGEQPPKTKVHSLVNNGMFSSSILSHTHNHCSSKSKLSPKHSAKVKDCDHPSRPSTQANDSASITNKQNSSKRKRTSSITTTVSDVDCNTEVTVSIPESSANMAAMPNPSLNPTALLKNHLDGTTTINSIEDFNIVVTNMDVVNGKIDTVQKPSTVRTKVNNDGYDQTNNKKIELGAKVINKARNRKPPILTKAHNNRIAPSTTSTVSANPVIAPASSPSPIMNGISFPSSPVMQSNINSSVTKNKLFTNHRVISPMTSDQFNAARKGSKFSTNSKQLLNSSLTNKNISQKSRISAKPAQFINLTQALQASSDRNSILDCEPSSQPMSTITYQQVITNQVLGIGHLQLQTTTAQKTNLSPTINITNSSQLKIPFLRPSSSPSPQARPLLLAADKNLPQTDLPGSPSLSS